jgi:hypothetical protein
MTMESFPDKLAIERQALSDDLCAGIELGDMDTDEANAVIDEFDRRASPATPIEHDEDDRPQIPELFRPVHRAVPPEDQDN